MYSSINEMIFVEIFGYIIVFHPIYLISTKLFNFEIDAKGFLIATVVYCFVRIFANIIGI